MSKTLIQQIGEAVVAQEVISQSEEGGTVVRPYTHPENLKTLIRTLLALLVAKGVINQNDLKTILNQLEKV